MEIPKKLSYGFREYFCMKCERIADFSSLPFDENLSIWAGAEFTECFIDIEGDNKPKPWFDTRVKMRWSDEGLYFLAIMQGDEVWANVKNRDEVIFQDNDFEIFLDPDGDTHNYIELEINAINTVWDLLLTKPYRNGGLPLNSFDIKGLLTKTEIREKDGKVQDWRTIIFMPFTSIKEVDKLHEDEIKIGDYYRLNFSRVHWNTDFVEGAYVKRLDEFNSVLPEENWVWSEQGLINMHYPENWGYLYFCDDKSLSKIKEIVRSKKHQTLCMTQLFLRKIWYLEHNYKEKFGCFADERSLSEEFSVSFSEVVNEFALEYKIYACGDCLRLTCNGDGEIVSLDEDGKLSLNGLGRLTL